MDQEHLLWIMISSYYYFYLIYCLLIDTASILFHLLILK